MNKLNDIIKSQGLEGKVHNGKDWADRYKENGKYGFVVEVLEDMIKFIEADGSTNDKAAQCREAISLMKSDSDDSGFV